MMNILSDVLNFCKQNVLDNIENEYSKIVGIESNLLINENDKYVGRVLLLINSPKLFLDQIIQFNKDKIKWQSSNCSGEDHRFYLVDPYWVTSYAPKPVIRVPVKVKVKDQMVVEIRELNFDQFQQSKLNEFYYINKVPHTLVAAYQNFYKMNRPGQYYKAINSTIKNYFITQDQLTHVISRFNQEKNRIKNEWNKHLNEHFQHNESARMIEKLFKKQVTKSQSNVISFKK